jgi:hypothetical protein
MLSNVQEELTSYLSDHFQAEEVLNKVFQENESITITRQKHEKTLEVRRLLMFIESRRGGRKSK